MTPFSARAIKSPPLGRPTSVRSEAGKTNLPAGDYTVYENESHLLTIRGEKGSILILGTPGSEAEEDKCALSFQHTDKGYTLKSVHSAGKSASIIPAARAER